MKTTFDAYLKQYKKQTGGKFSTSLNSTAAEPERPEILSRPDVKAIIEKWPEAGKVLAGILAICGECDIEVMAGADLIGATMKGPELSEAQKETAAIMLKLAESYNQDHKRRTDGEEYFKRPDADPKYKNAFDEIKKREATARKVLDDLKFIDGVFYTEDQAGYLKIYRETDGGGFIELKFKRRAA